MASRARSRSSCRAAIVMELAQSPTLATQRVATFSQRPDLRAADRIAWTTGRFSPRAKQEMGTAGWKVREGMDGAQK